jgi:hypothetical protein
MRIGLSKILPPLIRDLAKRLQKDTECAPPRSLRHPLSSQLQWDTELALHCRPRELGDAVAMALLRPMTIRQSS